MSLHDKFENQVAPTEEVKQDFGFIFREVLAPVVKTNWDDIKEAMGRSNTVAQFAPLSTYALISREKQG